MAKKLSFTKFWQQVAWAGINSGNSAQKSVEIADAMVASLKERLGDGSLEYAEPTDTSKPVPDAPAPPPRVKVTHRMPAS